MSKRKKTSYPGVFYREARRIGGKGLEKVYYIVFKKKGKVIEEKVGRQYVDDLTPAKVARIRSERIEGKRLSRKEFKEQTDARKKAEANRWTIDRIWNEYRAQKHDSKGLRTDTGRYDLYLKPRFGDKEPHELILLDMDRLRINLLKKKKPQTVKHILALLKRIINFGVQKNLCARLPFSIELPKVNNLKTEDLTSDELRRLLKAIESDPNIQVANFMKMALFTGMRRGELLKLQWNHIDFEKGFIHIVDPKCGVNQKIPLNETAKGILESHPRTDSPFIFPGKNGKQRVTVTKAANRIKKKAGLPDDFRSLHGLRHVYASMLASSGEVDMYTLQKLLTHKSPQMTQRYAHLRDEALTRAAGTADDIFKRMAGNKEDMKKEYKPNEPII